MTEEIHYELTVAVIVLYHPDIVSLEKNIKQLLCQVDQIILVDNSEDTGSNLELLKLGSKASYFHMGKNLGVAIAQNYGIKKAIENKASYILIMDQDSSAVLDMVDNLKNGLLLLKEKGYKISAIGPNAINEKTGVAYKPRLKKRVYFDGLPIFKISEIISSGSLISVNVFKEVGLMDEKLFIDGVDHEWCWRAAEKGYTCAMMENVALVHMLGEGDRKFLGFPIAITSSFRVYYQYRNYFYLLRKNYVPLYWKINNGIKYLIKAFYYPLFVKPRKNYFKNICRGISAGIGNR